MSNSYIFYYQGKSVSAAWCYNAKFADSFPEAYASEYDPKSAWIMRAAEVQSPNMEYNTDWFEKRAAHLQSLGTPFPEGFLVSEAGELTKAKPSKPRPQIPYEVFNTTAPDSDKCMDAVRALCKGIR